MVPDERTVTVGIGQARRRRATSTACRGQLTRPGQTSWRVRQADRKLPATRRNRASQARRRPAAGDLRRGGPEFDEDNAVRGPALPLLRDVLPRATLLWRLPGQRGDQARRAEPLRDRPRLLQGLRNKKCGVPVWGHRDGPGGDLNRILDPQALDPLLEACGGGASRRSGPRSGRGRSATTRSSPRPTCRPAGPTSRTAAATASAAATTARSSTTTSDPTRGRATCSRRA